MPRLPPPPQKAQVMLRICSHLRDPEDLRDMQAESPGVGRNLSHWASLIS